MSKEDNPAPVPAKDSNKPLPDWLKEPPYSWEVPVEDLGGFEQRYENSCWCGASESSILSP